KAPKIIPVKIMVSILIVRSTRRAKPMTRNIVTVAPSMLKNSNVYVPMNGIDKPKKSVITAPTEAPEDTTSVYGSESGFFNSPGNQAAALANSVRTTRGSTARGIGIYHNVLCPYGSVASESVPYGIFTEPVVTQGQTAAGRVPADAMYAREIVFAERQWIS